MCKNDKLITTHYSEYDWEYDWAYTYDFDQICSVVPNAPDQKGDSENLNDMCIPVPFYIWVH